MTDQALPMELRVWHIPQVPGTPFEVNVRSLEDAKLLLRVLADYDAFQREHRIKPDYANASGLIMFDPDLKAWTDWYDDETGEDDIWAVIRREKEC